MCSTSLLTSTSDFAFGSERFFICGMFLVISTKTSSTERMPMPSNNLCLISSVSFEIYGLDNLVYLPFK